MWASYAYKYNYIINQYLCKQIVISLHTLVIKGTQEEKLLEKISCTAFTKILQITSLKLLLIIAICSLFLYIYKYVSCYVVNFLYNINNCLKVISLL